MNIYQLSTLQQELIDSLYWEDDEDKAEYLQACLDKVEGDVKQKLEYLSTVLAEIRAITEARTKASQESRKRQQVAENAEERLKNFILDAMKQFSIKKVDGKHRSIILCPGRERIVYPDDFDAMELPEFARKTIIVVNPIAEEVKKLIEDGEIDGPIIVKEPYIMVK
jgi:Siphovirus Gp157